MARAKRSKPPVSDKSLYLWLSAVLGVWCGCTQATVGLVDVGYWNIWRTATVAIAVLLSVVVISSHRRASLGLAIVGAAVSVACATIALNICWDFTQLLFPESPIEGVKLIGFQALVMTYAILTIRFLMAWIVLWVCAIVLRPFYRRFLPVGPTECRWCRYDHAGLPDHEICPECGRQWNPPSYHRIRMRAVRRASGRSTNLIRMLCRLIVGLAIAGFIVSQAPMAIMMTRYHGLSIEKGNAYGVGTRPRNQIGGEVRTNFVIRDSRHHDLYLVITTDSTIWPWKGTQVQPLRSALYSSFPVTDAMGNGVSKPIVRQTGLLPRGTVTLFLETQPRRYR